MPAGEYSEQLELGPCEVYYGTAGSEAVIGALTGGATLHIEQITADLKKDSFGDGAYDKVIVGANAWLEGNLGDLNYYALSLVIPGAVLTDDGDATPAQSKLTISVSPGTSMRDNAKSLVIKRIVNGSASSDQDDWWTFPISYATANVVLQWDATTQRTLPIRFDIFPNASSKMIGYKGYATPA